MEAEKEGRLRMVPKKWGCELTRLISFLGGGFLACNQKFSGLCFSWLRMLKYWF